MKLPLMAHMQQRQCLQARYSSVLSVNSRALAKASRLRLLLRAGRSSTTVADAAEAPTAAAAVPFSKLLPRQAIAMFASGAVLGPFCDGLHSQHDVLHYVSPSVNLHLQAGSLQWSFETCWWVPVLFGVAGVILGVSVPLLDEALTRTQQQQQQQPPLLGAAAHVPFNPSWASVLACIALFVTQYGLSGVLEQPLLGHTLVNSPVPALDAILCAYALSHWAVFDKTQQGFGMAALTAFCGPLVEVGLINLLGLYSYSHPMVLGVPTWIPWVYFCGGPAVGNLGRKVWHELKATVG